MGLFDEVPDTADQEIVDVLLRSDGLRIERIVSTGQCSPDGFWYDQDEHEWVVLLKGQAVLVFENPPERIELKAGNYLHISAHRKHRVESTAQNEPTVWLAVFHSGSYSGKDDFPRTMNPPT